MTKTLQDASASIRPLDASAFDGAAPGPDWSLSPDAVREMRAIDTNIRDAVVQSSEILLD